MADLATPDPEDLPLRLEDYALIGDCTTSALVGRNGSIDWLCWPRFDSDACFAALLDTPRAGRWKIAPAGAPSKVSRRYRPGTLILETEFETDTGVATVTDFIRPSSLNGQALPSRAAVRTMHWWRWRSSRRRGRPCAAK